GARRDHPGARRPLVPRSRCPTAHGGMGQHALHCPQHLRLCPLAADRPRPGTGAVGHCGNAAQRRSPRCDRSGEAHMKPLAVERLTVTYPNGRRALDNVDLHIDEGQRTAVVGRSGSGKTTLVRTVLGLLPAGTTVEGSVRVAGTEVLGTSRRTLRELRGRFLGYIPQNPHTACDPLRTVGHHVTEAWTAHRATPPAGAVAAGLTSVGIGDAGQRARQHPHQWSGGMLQRATLVAAGAHDPRLTLADEPTSALDAALADEVLDLVTRQCTALLLISHDLGLVGNHADQVLVL